MIVPKSTLELLQGEPRGYSVTMADGREKKVRFCGTCGTRLWGEPPRFPQIAVVRPGSLDDTSWIYPVAHIWTGSAQPWVSIPNDTPNFEGQPDDPMALINAWQERPKR
jgi:hypothetical protein